MYVGNGGFFGFIHYLVCAVSLLLSQRPNQLSVTVMEDGFRVEADTLLPMQSFPFEKISESFPRSFEATVLNALSETLSVEIQNAGIIETVRYKQGLRHTQHSLPGGESVGERTVLLFSPDRTIFSAVSLSPEILTSYLRRLSFLHSGVRFILTDHRGTQEFCAERGIIDLFTAVASPYQILHQPLHLIAHEGSVYLECVFAFHSWSDEVLWCFINNGRAVSGGSHQSGFQRALGLLRRRLYPKQSSLPVRDNGIIGVLSVHSPSAIWAGCLKDRISDPALEKIVARLIFREAMAWLQAHPEEARHLTQITTFSFPDGWAAPDH
ncbi:MAG: hypothetical protein OHK0029_23590 [Armatimonadaceae bacterium]